MTKIIKETIIMLLVCLAGIIIFGLAFYKFAPYRKEVVEVVTYTASEQISEQLADNIGEQDDKIIKTYEVTSSDLNNFKSVEKYVPGKANPFASVIEDPETGATPSPSPNPGNGNDGGDTGLPGNGSEGGSEYYSDDGTK